MLDAFFTSNLNALCTCSATGRSSAFIMISVLFLKVHSWIFYILNTEKKKLIFFLQHVASKYADYIQNQCEDTAIVLQENLKGLSSTFFDTIKGYLQNTECSGDCEDQEFFSWESRKGRTRYCDVVAIDIICKINQNIYPVGMRLPNGPLVQITGSLPKHFSISWCTLSAFFRCRKIESIYVTRDNAYKHTGCGVLLQTVLLYTL